MSESLQTDDLRIIKITNVDSPEGIQTQLPINDQSAELIVHTRQAIHRILTHQDDRLLVVIGPCSIHDPESAIDYAKKLQAEIAKHANELLIVMRVYFEKPRTTIGWKGLINDPDLDETFDINQGLTKARKLLLDINTLGVPAATEYLDLISPQYIADLISWGAIGARTTESQGHRELASGLSCPVGFKNGTDGNVRIAVDAIRASSREHIFLSLTKEGQSAIFHTAGNDDCHVILRGGHGRPNYDEVSVQKAAQEMLSANLTPNLMVDCSHANSEKIHNNQLNVAKSIQEQLAKGQSYIIGAMVEGHLVPGNQPVDTLENLTYGQSITDACLGWEENVEILAILAKGVKKRRVALQSAEV